MLSSLGDQGTSDVPWPAEMRKLSNIERGEECACGDVILAACVGLHQSADVALAHSTIAQLGEVELNKLPRPAFQQGAHAVVVIFAGIHELKIYVNILTLTRWRYSYFLVGVILFFLILILTIINILINVLLCLLIVDDSLLARSSSFFQPLDRCGGCSACTSRSLHHVGSSRKQNK